MPCDNCKERPAAVHLTQIVNNAVTTLHLCDQCAAEKGVQTSAAAAELPVAGILASMGKGAAAALPMDGDTRRCDFCGGTLQDFRETGRLGCPHCYETFETHLRSLLRRLHGSTQHVGKVYLQPADAPGQPDRRLRDLKGQLQRAVDAENFELAAEIRDQIKVLE